ncbi:acyl-CoA dehydrogenase [Amycolatopsis jejuensis]|uniref:acyl-CoA dehydrogenase n=1 Tax=Amycolatopsis jejuensis TaxID=330084 RepID=UPI0005249F2C|nr:acyl-CoA dehydrogenase [Amycolatopsis jejuensis]
MNDVIRDLQESVRAVCARHGSGPLWTELEGIGVTTLSVPEEYGGSGGDVATAVAVLEVLGSAPVPLAETALLAGWLLASVGLDVPRGPMTAAIGEPGVVRRVPWARSVEHLVLLRGNEVRVLRPGEFSVQERVNLAGEPRDDVTCTAGEVHRLPFDAEREFRTRAALGRAALIAGAAREALELSIAYAGEREQFGRPIGKFQAVQHHLAAMAGEVLLTKVAVEAAARTLDEVAVAAAKTVASQAAGVVASLAHQIHGALGYTEEHRLRHSTTRLWAWRDEAGNEAAWSSVMDEHVQGGALWPLLTGGGA